MTNEAYTLQQTNRDRSITGRSARHKKSGSKSTACTMPSDRMSYKEKKALSGDTATYDLHTLTWKQFLKLAPDTQQCVLDIYREHGARGSDVAELLGISKSHFCKYLKESKLESKWKRGGNVYRKPEWDAFLCYDKSKIPVATEDVAETESTIPVIPVETESTIPVIPVETDSKITTTVTVHGISDLAALVKRLEMFWSAGCKADYSITINF